MNALVQSATQAVLMLHVTGREDCLPSLVTNELLISRSFDISHKFIIHREPTFNKVGSQEKNITNANIQRATYQKHWKSLLFSYS